MAAITVKLRRRTINKEAIPWRTRSVKSAKKGRQKVELESIPGEGGSGFTLTGALGFSNCLPNAIFVKIKE